MQVFLFKLKIVAVNITSQWMNRSHDICSPLNLLLFYQTMKQMKQQMVVNTCDIFTPVRSHSLKSMFEIYLADIRGSNCEIRSGNCDTRGGNCEINCSRSWESIRKYGSVITSYWSFCIYWFRIDKCDCYIDIKYWKWQILINNQRCEKIETKS